MSSLSRAAMSLLALLPSVSRKTITSVFALLLVATVLPPVMAQTASAEPAAIVVRATGHAVLEREGQRDFTLSGLDLIYPGDDLFTGAGGSLLIRFTDDTLIELGPYSQLSVEAYQRIEGAPADTRLTVRMREGTTRWLTRQGGRHYQLITPQGRLSRLQPDTEFEVVLSDTRGTEAVLYAGGMEAANESDTAVLRTVASYVRIRDAAVLDASTQVPLDLNLSGPIPPEPRAMRFNRWSWRFQDSPRSEGADSVLDSDSLAARYRERTRLPAPVPVRPEPVPEPDDVEDHRLALLASLIRQRQDAEAFQLAESMRLEFEGEPDYDVLYGRAAMNVGAYQRAAFALERVLMMHPREHDVRLMLVEAYIGVRNTSAARRQLDRLQESNLSARQQARWEVLDRRLRRLKLAQQETETFTLGAELQYYTNINSGLNSSSLDIETAGGPTLTYEPDDDARAQGAPAITLQGSYSRMTPLTQRLRRTLQAGATTRQSTFDDAVNYGLFFSAGLAHSDGREGSLQVLPSWTTDGFQVTTQLTATHRELFEPVNVGALLAWTAGDDQNITLQGQTFETIEIADIPTDWRVAAGFNVSDNENQNHLLASGSLQPLWRPEGSFIYQGLAALQGRYYLEENPLYGERRRDLRLTLQALALRPVTESSVVTGRMTYNHSFSNLSLYAYYGAELAIGYQHSW